MVPPTPGIGHVDKTERLIFERIEAETPNGWVGLHHVGLPRHRTKPIAEIDFIVISEHGVFCLEVKGGASRCENGVWFAGTRELKESPFQQVGSASADLRFHLEAVHPFVFGFGCVFPHCAFDVESPEVLPEVVYDASCAPKGFEAYLKRVGNYWRARYPDAKTLGANDIGKVAHALRPDFETVESVLHRVAEVRGRLVKFTDEQDRAIQGLRDTEQVVVKGGAGTGKTLIAATEAMRLADSGRRTLLTCFTKALAAQLTQKLRHPNLAVTHIDRLISDLINAGGTRDMIPDDAAESDRLAVYRPLAAIEGAKALGRLEEFGAIVVDEGQDLLTQPRLDVLDSLLEAGLRAGVWRIFWDHQQALFAPDLTVNLGLLTQMGATPSPYALTVNCRNTTEIARRGEVLSGVTADEATFVEGPDACDEVWDGEKTQMKRLRAVVTDWLDRGVSADSMVILSPRRFENSIASSELKLSMPVHDHSGDLFSPTPDAIPFSTIHSFKGLEADAVLLVDVEDIDSAWARSLLYVGASRARVLLATLRSKDTTPSFARRMAAQATRAGRGSTGAVDVI